MTSSETAKKNVVVILNGISLHKKIFYHNIFPLLSNVCNLTVTETLSRNDAVSLASKAVDQSADVVFAAGGDGTLNQVLNGILKGRETDRKLPVLGLIPIGSGNDFARTVNVKADVKQLVSLLQNFSPRLLDIGKVRFTPWGQGTDTERYFVNVADIGMGPIVVDKVLKSGRPFGHGMAYYKSILSTFLSYKPMPVKVESENWSWEGKLRTLAVGNGKYYGHGLCIAPDAIPDDRMFTIFICGNVSVFDFIRHTSTLKKARFISLKEIHYKKATSVSLSSQSLCLIEGDGEILGQLPGRIELFDRQLEFLIK